MIEIEAIGPVAAPVLAEIHRQAFADPWPAAEIAILAASPGAFAFAANLDEDLAGFILCRVAADEAEVLTIATLPAHRRRGVGRALLAAAKAAALASGATSLFLEVAIDNLVALGLYAAEGFAPVGRRPRYFVRRGGDVDAVIMRALLNR